MKSRFLAVPERYKGGPWRGADWLQRGGGQEIIRAFHAVRVEDGKFVARWQAHFPSRFYDANFERFHQVGGRLYFVASSEFTELKEDDVIDGKNGWKAVAGDK